MPYAHETLERKQRARGYRFVRREGVVRIEIWDADHAPRDNLGWFALFYLTFASVEAAEQYIKVHGLKNVLR